MSRVKVCVHTHWVCVWDPCPAALATSQALFLYRYGDDLQHGGRNRRHDVSVPLQPQDEEVPEQDRPGG